MIESASLMEVAVAVWSNVFMDGRPHSGETLLVHGGSSGIGTMAIQMAKARGAQVVVTVGSKEKAEACERLGADLALNYREVDFCAAFAERGMAADVVLDIMGGSHLDQNVRSLAKGGRLVVIGLQ